MTNHTRPHAPQMAKTSDTIQRHYHALQNGHRTGHQALDRLFPATQPIDPDSVCGEGCARRRDTSGTPNRIMDIYPSVPERLAVVEHMANDMDKQFEAHKQESIRASASFVTRDMLQDVKDDIANNVKPAIRDVQRNNTFKLTVVTVGAIASVIYSVIMTYKNLHP